MNLKFNGKYDKKLFFNAVRIANQPERNARLMHLLVAMVFGVMSVTTINELIRGGDFRAQIINIALILLMGLILYQAYVPSYLAARKMWTPELAQRMMSGKIAKDGIVYHFPQGDKSYLWSDFNRRRQTPNLITLITLGGMLLIFPRYFFKSDTDWARFTKLVETRVIVTKKK